MSPSEQHYYMSQEAKLLRDHDKVARQLSGVFVARYGSERSSEMMRQARGEYRRLIPQLPYIGGEQPFTQFIIASAWFLAMHRVLQREGGTVRDAGQLAYQLTRTYLERVPGFARHFLGGVSFSQRYQWRLRKRAAESQRRRYPGGYVYSYVEGDGIRFDYGVDYNDCATWKFLQEQGAPDLAPYLCAIDHLYSELLGWGLMRTMTLAEGGDRYDFRFKRGGPTRVSSAVLDLG